MEDLQTPKWNDLGLVPAIVQDAQTGAVLMMAWMNPEALRQTRESGFAHFYSRSRKRQWKKGETSGNTLAVKELRIDCDGDTILIIATPTGPACHTGKTTCFFQDIDGEPVATFTPPAVVLDRVFQTIENRRDSGNEHTSYTKSLLNGGMTKILAKIAEEHGELADELPAGETKAVVHETADLLFHVLVGLAAAKTLH